MSIYIEPLAPPLQHALDLMGFANMAELCSTLKAMSASELKEALADEEFKDLFAVRVLVANAFRFIELGETVISKTPYTD
jgi:hypothetical protein